jgi:hypothetical protein
MQISNLYDTNSHKFEPFSYELVHTNTAASALLPRWCRCDVRLRRAAAAASALLPRWRRRALRRRRATAAAAATAKLPPLRCAPPLRCRHHRATAKLPSRCALPPRCCHRAAAIALCAAAVLPPLLLPPPLHRSLVGCCVVVHRAAAIALPPLRCAPPPCCRCRCCCRCHCRRRCRCRHSIVHWLVVALLSTVRFCHRMPSCDRQRSHCQGEHFCKNWYVLIWTTSILVIIRIRIKIDALEKKSLV